MSTESSGKSLPERQYGSEMKEGILRPTASTVLDLIGTKLEDPNVGAVEKEHQFCRFDGQWSRRRRGGTKTLQ